jgi:HrpA-like RNA helicase
MLIKDSVEDSDINGDLVAFNKDSLFKPLPIEAKINEILYAIEKFNTTIVVGETGSGKSTKLPQYLF